MRITSFNQKMSDSIQTIIRHSGYVNHYAFLLFSGVIKLFCEFLPTGILSIILI